MDGAGAWSLYRAAAAIRAMLAGHAAASRKGAAVSTEALRESAGGAAAGADLGGSSKYSNENFED